MLKMKSGCFVPDPDRLEEGYTVSNGHIIANVGTDHIESMMQHFIMMHQEPLFFILELPASQEEETETSPNTVKNLHKNVYYIDGCSQQTALAIMVKSGKLLINDGMSSFGYGGHDSGEEIMFGRYNILTILCQDPAKYDVLFTENGIARNDALITAWDTFGPNHPGRTEAVTVDGQDVFALPQQYKEWGMYLAEQREE